MVRKCDVTGELMNEGWCAADGEYYFKYKDDAVKWCIEHGYVGLDDAYADEAIYFTIWSYDKPKHTMASFRADVIRYVLEELTDDVVLEHISYNHEPKQLFYDIWKPNL